MDPVDPAPNVNIHAIDVDAYLDRIGYSGARTPTPEVLEQLQFCHLTRIPFENLDIHLGRPIRLDLASLQAKLVGRRRGGYCFEQNTLFAAVLEQLGFTVTRLSGRVRLGTDRVLPRTHMLLNVTIEQTHWLTDVGFGGESLFRPIPMVSGRWFEQHDRTFRLNDDEGPWWVLQSLIEGVWTNLYAFTLEPQFDVDYEVASYYTSTHPDSRFVHTLTVQSRTPDVRQTLHNRDLEIKRNGQATLRAIDDHDELLSVLTERFGLEFPPGTRFQAPAPPMTVDEHPS
ncbi:N-hydroxyarylamine O-acetyltransferase [Singulisphaera sp. GP187]|uniref:arylamine N-acetyltransferase family protein n=1 Tax=Singulisphaera sp. GP187 TaxID=1882752 RepID=UPI000925B4B8|nr:arylamine N-acetyltransferase [Singulisphaera sp. GP187]SIN72823.1 N-hydroxyarylamine O-acetyltransferase [Singulisphaera sp. GP187]